MMIEHHECIGCYGGSPNPFNIRSLATDWTFAISMLVWGNLDTQKFYKGATLSLQIQLIDVAGWGWISCGLVGNGQRSRNCHETIRKMLPLDRLDPLDEYGGEECHRKGHI